MKFLLNIFSSQPDIFVLQNYLNKEQGSFHFKTYTLIHEEKISNFLFIYPLKHRGTPFAPRALAEMSAQNASVF